MNDDTLEQNVELEITDDLMFLDIDQGDFTDIYYESTFEDEFIII